MTEPAPAPEPEPRPRVCMWCLVAESDKPRADNPCRIAGDHNWADVYAI